MGNMFSKLRGRGAPPASTAAYAAVDPMSELFLLSETFLSPTHLQLLLCHRVP
jgi:hypothetical protein